MSDYPEDLKYTAEHEWVRSGNGSTCPGGHHRVRRGPARRHRLRLAAVGGESVGAGDACASSSRPRASRHLLPGAWVVSTVNALLDSNPETVNADPYGDGWLFELEMEEGADLDDLLDATRTRSGSRADGRPIGPVLARRA